MSALDTLLDNDLVRNALSDALLVRERRTTSKGAVTICCPLCITRGESKDTRFRCGIFFDNGIGFNCFNCNAKGRWKIGERLSSSMRNFLTNLGTPPREVQKISFWADAIRNMVATRPEVKEKLNITITPEFHRADLPHGSQSLEYWSDNDCDDKNYLDTVSYLLSRGDVVTTASTYYWTPEESFNRRLIIPCHHQDKLVGWTGRAIDSSEQNRYHKEIPKNFIFNSKFLTARNRRYVFIVEGTLDALVVDAISPMGAMLNEAQINWIIQSGKQPVVIPDRDRRGKDLVEIAIKQKWSVAFPHFGRTQWWDADIKDADDAVKRYGKLYTVQSIIASITESQLQIRQRMRYTIK